MRGPGVSRCPVPHILRLTDLLLEKIEVQAFAYSENVLRNFATFGPATAMQ